MHQSAIEARLDAEIETLLQTNNEFLFLTGGMGQFDDMAADAVRATKCRRSEKCIALALALPYMSNRLNIDKEYDQVYYDQIIIPEELDTAYYKAAIQRRNLWMVDWTIVIAYICRDFGGALPIVRYAQKQGKPVINLAKKVKSHISYYPHKRVRAFCISYPLCLHCSKEIFI